MAFGRLKLYRLGLKFPRTVLLISLLGTLVGAWAALKLPVGDIFTALLPRGTESAENLDRYKKYFGELGHLVVTVEADDPAKAERFADLLAEGIRDLPAVYYVDFRRPVEYFKDRKWLFVENKDLADIERRIDRALVLQKKGVSVVFNDLMVFADPADRPDLSFQDIEDKYAKKAGSNLEPFKQGREGRFLILWVKAKDLLGGVEGKRRFIAAVRETEKRLKGEGDFRDVQVGYTGAYENEVESVDLTQKEIVRVSVIVFALLLLILLAYFQRIDTTLLVGLPLLLGVIWTGGLTYLVLGHLNLLTGFAASILAGLGSDYGIYLLSRYQEERQAGTGFQAACHLAFGGTGRATFASVVTMVAAFLGLIFSHFKLFVEFGIVGAIGLTMNYLAMMLIIPSLLNLLHGLQGRPRGRPWLRHLARWNTLGSGRISASGPWLERLFLPRRAMPGLVLAGILLLLSVPTVLRQGHIEFESGQVGSLKIPSNELYDRVSGVTKGSLNPTVVMTRGLEEDREIVAKFDALLETEPDGLPYNLVAGLSSFIPPDQDEKKEAVRRILAKYREVRIPSNRARQDFIEGLESSLAAAPVTLEALPVPIRRLFESPKDPEVRAVYLFPSFARTGSGEILRYQDLVKGLEKRIGRSFSAVDGSFLSADAVRLVEKEAVRGGIFLMICLTVVLLLTVRPPVRAWVILGNMAVGMFLLSGLLWLCRIRLNVLNIASIPVILGTGVDSFFHFSFRFGETKNLLATLESKVAPVFVSNLTSIVGFGGLLLTSNSGLHSVGWVAVLGLTLITLLCFFIFPRCLLLEPDSKS